MKLYDAIKKQDDAKPKVVRPKIDPIAFQTRVTENNRRKQDAKEMGSLGKPFLIQLNADVEKAVEETRILWGLKSRAEVIRLLVGKGLATLI